MKTKEKAVWVFLIGMVLVSDSVLLALNVGNSSSGCYEQNYCMWGGKCEGETWDECVAWCDFYGSECWYINCMSTGCIGGEPPCQCGEFWLLRCYSPAAPQNYYICHEWSWDCESK